jgi:hypothetical protein
MAIVMCSRMSRFAKAVRLVDGHSLWGGLPRKSRRELAKFFESRKRRTLPLKQGDERLNKIVRRSGRVELQIVRLGNREEVVAARLARSAPKPEKSKATLERVIEIIAEGYDLAPAEIGCNVAAYLEQCGIELD